MGQETYQLFLENLLKGDMEEFTYTLQKYLLGSMSYFDASGDEPEKFYHGFVLGLIASLQDSYTIQSNRESGHGRYDVMIIPKDKSKLGLVLEFKTVRAKDDINVVALEALQQVKDKQYETELRQKGIQSILKLGLAFKGKEVVVVHE